MPSVGLVTEQFAGLAQATSNGRRLSELPIVVLPHGFDELPDAQIRDEVRRRMPDILGALTTPR